MFDTHCHLNTSEFEEDIYEVLDNAKASGVNRILVPGINIQSSKRAIDLSQKYPFLYASVGIHPSEKLDEENLNKDISLLEKIADNQNVVAMGEIGLDYYKYETAKRIQEIYFRKQVDLAAKLGLSIIIHNRQSSQALIDILEDAWRQAFEESVVFHCAEPDSGLLDFAIKNHIYWGVDGDITYNKDKQEFIKNVPLELIVFETDSPYLTPLPVRNEGVSRNEPQYLPLAISKASDLLNIGKKELIKTTSNNALKLFNLV
jgi:TatD DNase family protein